MMSKNVRILVVAVGLVMLGFGSSIVTASSIPEVRDMVCEDGPTGPVIHLQATGGLETVHYSPQPGIWIIEMPEASWSGSSKELSEPGIGIQNAELSHVTEFGKSHSRLTVQLDRPAQLDLASTDNGLTLRFAMLNVEPSMYSGSGESSPTAVSRTVSEPLPELPKVTTRVTTQDAPVAVQVPAPQVEPDTAAVQTAVTATASAGPSVASEAADLLALEVVRAGSGVVVRMNGNTSLQGTSFTLDSPPRLVVDLDGVINRVDQHVFSVGSELVRRVRVAQHQAVPTPVTRIVVDLEQMTDYQLAATEHGALLTVAADRAVAEASFATTTVGAEGTVITNLDSSGEIEVVRSAPRNSTSRNSAPESDTDVLDVETATSIDAAGFEMPAPEAQQPKTESPQVAEFVPERDPWVAHPSQLIEAAPAPQDYQTQTDDSYDITEVENAEVQFTGDPISLTLKDADIKDVLKTFSALTRLNIVIDPEVSGSVTVELRDVPWDQCLHLILQINGLDYVLENNVLRVSTVRKLTAEKKARAQYLAEQEFAEPLKTVVKPLSYARAADVRSLVSGDSFLISPRGSMVVDVRTNTLVIRDTIDRVEGILRLIETLDLPTPQVVIEGRIVETTRNFSRELGVQWGFQTWNDVDHGNTTGLRFPSSVESEGNVNLRGAGDAGVLAMTFSDILNTFNLDFVLAAAESEGIAKIVSTPRVTTQNLKTASIRSGLQVPVQTVANNTVTVQYTDATLRLQVTPQITAEGTVNLQVNIQKRQPLQAGQITGGTNAPILTRDAQTELLVRDGGTTVIGGIYQLDDENQDNRVPGLWKIPVLGNLFRQKAVNQRHDELLIFITPRIVKY